MVAEEALGAVEETIMEEVGVLEEVGLMIDIHQVEAVDSHQTMEENSEEVVVAIVEPLLSLQVGAVDFHQIMEVEVTTVDPPLNFQVEAVDSHRAMAVEATTVDNHPSLQVEMGLTVEVIMVTLEVNSPVALQGGTAHQVVLSLTAEEQDVEIVEEAVVHTVEV